MDWCCDLIGKGDPARRYLAQSTSLNRFYGPACWAYYHSFAKELAVFEYEFECTESRFRTTAEIVTHRATRNKEEISVKWEFVFNNLDQCSHSFRSHFTGQPGRRYFLLAGLAINRNCFVTPILLNTCIEDLINEDSVIIKLMKFVSPQEILMPLASMRCCSTITFILYPQKQSENIYRH
uniref:Uncharacterized protein n=1 Tax=Glossina austeni TaxID=7395 RepID=A0A1A9V6R8_GLOAU